MDIPEVRRRVRAAIDQARRDAAARRERSDTASRAYDQFLGATAVPAFNTVASALVGEGHRFNVSTPAGSVRLTSERSADDYVELMLDSSEDPPVVLGRTNAGRGRRTVTKERPLRAGVSPDAITDDDVVTFVLAEVITLIER